MDPDDRLVSRLSTPALRSAARRSGRPPRSRVGPRERPGRALTHDLAALRLPRHQPPSPDDGPLHDARGAADARAGPAGGPPGSGGAPAGGVCSQLRPPPRLPRRRRRIHHLGDERALRVSEVREAVGSAARQSNEQRGRRDRVPAHPLDRYVPVARGRTRRPSRPCRLSPDPLRPHRHGDDLARRPEPGAADGDGPLRARPAGLAGRARRRRIEAARQRGAAVRRLLAEERVRRARGVAARQGLRRRPARRGPCARPDGRRAFRHGAVDEDAPEPRPLLVAARRVDFHLKRHAFSKWKYRQVDVFIAASRLIASMLDRGRDSRGPHRDRARRRRRRRRRSSRPSTPTRRSGCRTARRSSATSPRWSRTRDSGIWWPPPRASCARCPTRGS